MTERNSRTPWAWRLWLVTSVLFLLAAWRQPATRASSLALAVVFGIFAARLRGQRGHDPASPRAD